MSKAAFVHSNIISSGHVLAGSTKVIVKTEEQQENDNNDNDKPTAATTTETAKSHKNASSQYSGIYIIFYDIWGAFVTGINISQGMVFIEKEDTNMRNK